MGERGGMKKEGGRGVKSERRISFLSRSFHLSFQPDTCFIDSMCYVFDQTDPNNSTQACQPALSQTQWTPKSGQQAQSVFGGVQILVT